ncbi:hypothetical protein [Paenibacillus naphthalenovorans]|uniref:hypothetical protein n=1 Tax=Paenibacillus naphthalenovorans TaxID=162209 RepID=UPI000945B533|nr:hypothetical protein [Paenibacillus naphthalenovorans]
MTYNKTTRRVQEQIYVETGQITQRAFTFGMRRRSVFRRNLILRGECHEEEQEHCKANVDIDVTA